jgi:CheY-like chemotaxis protein
MIGRQTILLLEDNESDVFIFRRALAVLDYRGSLRLVQTVREARQYMLSEGSFEDTDYFAAPDLIVADFKLRGEHGLEFTEWVHIQSRFAHIPVIFFCGSLPELNVREVLLKHGWPVFIKHADFHAFTDTVREMVQLLDKEPANSAPARPLA